MATHPLGAGTCNLSVNVRSEWRASLGRMAFERRLSIGKLVRRMLAIAGRLGAASAQGAIAEQYDKDAVRILEGALSGRLDDGERNAISEAIRDIKLSGAVDHDLAESTKF